MAKRRPAVGLLDQRGRLHQWAGQGREAWRFYVAIVNFACEPGSAGSEYKLVVGDKSIGGTIDATGSWDITGCQARHDPHRTGRER